MECVSMVEGRGVSGLCSGADIISDSFWAVQRRRHHQRRARSSGSAQAIEGPVDRGGIANKQQQHTRTSGGFSRAHVYSSCSRKAGRVFAPVLV